MFRINPEIKKQALIHKLLNNGYRFCVMANGKILQSWRYEYEALRHHKKNEIVAIRDLI